MSAWVPWPKYTAQLCVLSKPALHLVKACLFKPIWAYHCAPREDKQGPHALTYEKHLAEAIVLCLRKKKNQVTGTIKPCDLFQCVHLLEVTSLPVENNRALSVQMFLRRMWCWNRNDSRHHVTASPEMTFHHISMSHRFYHNKVTWPAWYN